MVSRIPFKARFTFDPSRLDFYLPIIGIFPAMLGVLVYGACTLVTGSPLITVLVTLIIQYLGFNLFHLDGLVDTADAFLGSFEKEKRFAILKDSRIGTYGLFAGMAVFALKAALLYSLIPFIPLFPAVILAYPISGRFGAALIPCMTQPAKPDGLGILLKNSSLRRCIAGVLAGFFLWAALLWGSLALAALVLPLNIKLLFIDRDLLLLLAASLTGPPVSLGMARLYRKHLGGYTGDALGAAVELAELFYMAAAFLALRIMGQ